MPLHCDCYGGCWAEHSEAWPKVGRAVDAKALYQLAHTTLPYGTYVIMSGQPLRVETPELAAKLEAAFESQVTDTLRELGLAQ